MDKEMFEGFDMELRDLKPEVKEKVIELATSYLSQGFEPKAALNKAIATAEVWFMDLEG